MAFVVGNIFLPNTFTRWCGQIIGAGAAAGQWRAIIQSPVPTPMQVNDVDDGVTVFNLGPAVATPPNKPPPGTIVKVLQAPLPYFIGAPLSTFPGTLPGEPFVGQVWIYVNPFGVYCVLIGDDGTLFLALPEELTL